MPKTSHNTTDNEDQGISASEAAELRRQLEAANSRLASAERTVGEERSARRKAELATMSHEERLVATQQDSCESEIALLESEADALSSQIAALADEPGHGKEIAELTRKLSRAEAKMESATQRKDWLAGERDRITGKNKEARERVERQDDIPAGEKLPNGAPISNFYPATQQWMRDHPRIFTDQQYFNRAVRYATEAVEDLGIKDQSPDYFRHIEKKLGEASGTTRQADPDPEEDEDEEGDDIRTERSANAEERYTPENPQRGPAGPGSMAARPSRTVPQGGGDRGGRQVKARLSAEEKEVADGLYANIRDPAERYAKYAQGKNFMSNLTRQNFH